MTSTVDCEILDIYSYHVFTSGVTPIMSLAASLGEKGDIVDFYNYYERGRVLNAYLSSYKL